MLNSISIHGRLCQNPELKTTQSGISVCVVNVAVDRSYAKQGEEKQTDFFTVVFWKNLADTVSRYFSKGKEIVISGSMQMRKYDDREGNSRTVWELVANSIDFCGSRNETESKSISNTDISHVTCNNSFTPVPDDDLPF